MTIEEFSKKIRSGDSKFGVSKVTLFAEGQRISGRGQLLVESTRITLDFEPTKLPVPEPKRHVWKAADSWKLKGTIEGDLKFSSDFASPGGRRHSWNWRKSRTIHDLRLGNLELAPMGFDALTTAQKDRLLGKVTRRSKYPKVYFFAVLTDYKPAFLNAGTETKVRNDFLGSRGGSSSFDSFIDRGKDYDFALIKRDADLHIHFESKARFRSTSEDNDWHRFRSLLDAIGFTHGIQPWPYWTEYSRDKRIILYRVTAPSTLTKTVHAPFDQGIGMKHVGRKGVENSPIRLAARFFEKRTHLSDGLKHLLFLFRECGDCHFDVRTLAICSLFEGVVDLLFDELQLENVVRAKDPQFDSYTKVRNRLVKCLRKIAARSGRGIYQRLVGVLSHAEPIRVKDKYQAVCEFLGLDFEKEMKKRFEAWAAERNLLAHGAWGTKDEAFDHQALIAGAINILVLKAMGFSGLMKGNAYAREVNDRYSRI